MSDFIVSQDELSVGIFNAETQEYVWFSVFSERGKQILLESAEGSIAHSPTSS